MSENGVYGADLLEMLYEDATGRDAGQDQSDRKYDPLHQFEEFIEPVLHDQLYFSHSGDGYVWFSKTYCAAKDAQIRVLRAEVGSNGEQGVTLGGLLRYIEDTHELSPAEAQDAVRLGIRERWFTDGILIRAVA